MITLQQFIERHNIQKLLLCTSNGENNCLRAKITRGSEIILTIDPLLRHLKPSAFKETERFVVGENFLTIKPNKEVCEKTRQEMEEAFK